MFKIEHVVGSRDNYKQKKWQPTENIAHIVLLVILRGK